jgi:hypothetical protein
MSDAPKGEGPPDRLRSVELAELIVDALLRASIVGQQDVKRAVRIATEEVDARKAIGDY